MTCPLGLFALWGAAAVVQGGDGESEYGPDSASRTMAALRNGGSAVFLRPAEDRHRESAAFNGSLVQRYHDQPWDDPYLISPGPSVTLHQQLGALKSVLLRKDEKVKLHEHKEVPPNASPFSKNLMNLATGDPLGYVAGKSKIPPYLFLTSRYSSLEALPSSVRQNVQNTLDLNPGLTVTWFDDNDCLRYIEEQSEKRVLDLFKRAVSGKYRSDLCRTLVLLHRGGFYVDLDVEMKMPFDKLVDQDTSFMSVWAVDGDVLNALIGTEAHSPIINMTLEEMKKGDDVHALQAPAKLAEEIKQQTGVVKDLLPAMSVVPPRLQFEQSGSGVAPNAEPGKDDQPAGAGPGAEGGQPGATPPAAADGQQPAAAADGQPQPTGQDIAPNDPAAPADGQQPAAPPPVQALHFDLHRGDATEPLQHAAAPSSLEQNAAREGYPLWGPKTLRAGLIKFFLTCGVESTILPSAELQTADYAQCGQKIRMYTEMNMRRPIDPGKHMHPLYYILHHKHSISNNMLRAALNAEGRNRTEVKLKDGKILKKFDGLDFGLFYTGYPNFLVGYSRFADCTTYGCGIDGGSGSGGKKTPPSPQGSPAPPDLPNSDSNAPVFRPEAEEAPPPKINPLNDVHQQKLAKLDRSLRNLRRQINEHQHPAHRRMRGWDPVSDLEIGPELLANPSDAVFIQMTPSGPGNATDLPLAGLAAPPARLAWMHSHFVTTLLLGSCVLAPVVYHALRAGFVALCPKTALGEIHARLCWGLLYAVCCIVMTVSNKVAVQGCPVLLSALQMAFAAGALIAVGDLGLGSLADMRFLGYWLPVPIFFVLMITSSLSGFAHESISTCVMMGSLRPLYALSIERVCHGESPSWAALIGCALLCLGASFYVVGSGGNTSGGVTMIGVLVLVGNGMTAAVDRCYQHYMLVHRSIAASRPALLLTSNLGGLAILAACPWLWTSEWEPMRARVQTWWTPEGAGDLNLVLLSCIGGLGIGYAGLGFQKTVSASSFLAVATGVRAFLLLIDNRVLGTELHALAASGLMVVIFGSVICVDDQNRKSAAKKSLAYEAHTSQATESRRSSEPAIPTSGEGAARRAG